MDFKGKTAFVTGVARGIGRAVASEEASYISGQNYIVDGCRKKM